ncbi:nondiscriminating glutamyl-tRNA synthetase EARS2, mitochondrial-like [Littorina saxatilis]|uniref:Nondiscriminating glutamyl-tRNA synthetase EARS2, mitochondrial n=1 Tax=Littorina saxatilis TaxID=31220 RepID=A0AAN9APH7_9CAEN
MAAPMRFCLLCRQHLHQTRQLHLSSYQMSAAKVRVRFAPSPTGFLHLGGLRTALYNYLFAKSKGGTFVLRIEDTDQSRVVPGALEKLESMLEWTGVIPDEGPSHGGNFHPYVQSDRLELYQESVKALIKNETAYYCFCTPKRLDLLRRDAVRRGETPRYDNRCRHLQPEEVKDKLAGKAPFTIRLKLEPTPDPWDDMIKGPVSHNVAEIEGDPVLMKSDGFPTYHLANVVDDHHMEVTHVLRGDEWQPSAPKHILLYKAFGWQAPRFAHLPLIVNKDGTKLSKRQGDIHVEHFKEKGYLPEAVVSYVTTIGGGFDCDTSSLTLKELVQHFQIERVNRHHGRLDQLFLERSNHAHLSRIMESEERIQLVTSLRSLLQVAYGDRTGERTLGTELFDRNYLLHVLEWAVGEDRISKLSDLLQPEFAFLWETPGQDQVRSLQSQHSDLVHLLSDCLLLLDRQVTYDKGSLAETLRGHARSSGVKVSVYMHLMRQALSGMKEGPPVAEMMTVMGKDNTLRRLQHSVKLLQSPS